MTLQAAYICNLKDSSPQPCDVIAGMASQTISKCGDFGQTEGVSGYQDSYFGDYRVIVAYGNCNKAADRGPDNQSG